MTEDIKALPAWEFAAPAPVAPASSPSEPADMDSHLPEALAENPLARLLITVGWMPVTLHPMLRPIPFSPTPLESIVSALTGGPYGPETIEEGAALAAGFSRLITGPRESLEQGWKFLTGRLEEWTQRPPRPAPRPRPRPRPVPGPRNHPSF